MTSDPLHRVQTRRTTLYHATLDLEHAIGLPTGDLQNWRSQTLTAARQLADRITEHTRQAEAPGEFLDLVTTQAPHLVNAAKKLEAEHDNLTRHSVDLLDMIERLNPTDGLSTAEEIRRSALQLMGLLIRHRQQGADLIYLAYNEDLGSSG